eukprot:Tamp_10169.p1 GENE.Tamp_10169~~Tamp_10169.p1  ORF type:complete len:438 (-),score=49.32 Tamp_10169:115-1428(-)
MHVPRRPVSLHRRGRRQTTGQAKTKKGPNIAHEGPILCVVAEKDFVISGGVDGTIKLWRMESAPGSACARKYLGHKGAVWTMTIGSLTHDQEEIQVLISGSADRTVAIWNLFGPKDAPPIMTLQGHFGCVSAVCFVPWRNQVVSGGEDCTIRIWSLATGLCETVLEGNSDAISDLLPWRGRVEGANVDVVFSASREGDIRMWDLEAAVQLRRVDAHAGPVTSLYPSLVPEKCFISTSVDGILRLWKPDDLMCWRSIHPPMPSDLAAEEQALRQQIQDEEEAALAKIENSLNAVDLESPQSPQSPLSGDYSPDASPRRRGGYLDRLGSLDDGMETVPPPRESLGESLHDLQESAEVVFSGLQGEDWTRTRSAGSVMPEVNEQQEEEEEEETSSSSDDENAVPKDFEGAGGFTKAILWGNVLIASSWDGLIRLWVYTED